MQGEKLFLISKDKKTGTSVSVGSDLGRILMRSEVDEIASNFDSEVKRSLGFTLIEVVPPISSDKLDKFGEALVKLASILDPTDPKPQYKIR